MNFPGRQVPNMLLEISGEITPVRMKGCSQNKNNTQLWMGLVIEVRSNAVKSNIAQELQVQFVFPCNNIISYIYLVKLQYVTGEEWRNSSKTNEETEPKQNQHRVVDMTGDGSKV